MHYELNFGPAEHTREQRRAIADQALAITLAEGHAPTAELLALYDRYVAGETDLYAISVHVGGRARQQLHAQLGPIALSLQTPNLPS
ncbi:antitoxin VbhA family protein [Hymenobacter terricola]|uniref:antitoxin VbhA family protein n=1 Tax=Hymenobacter terricola TaxID=2819236 RepID=UPI001B304DC5|nr:antitoxin VbhA family protein [Hymenobacter terricola]